MGLLVSCFAENIAYYMKKIFANSLVSFRKDLPLDPLCHRRLSHWVHPDSIWQLCSQRYGRRRTCWPWSMGYCRPGRLWQAQASLISTNSRCNLGCKVHRILSYVSLGTYVKIRIRTCRILASQVRRYVSIMKLYDLENLHNQTHLAPILSSRLFMRSLETIKIIFCGWLKLLHLSIHCEKSTEWD